MKHRSVHAAITIFFLTVVTLFFTASFASSHSGFGYNSADALTGMLPDDLELQWIARDVQYNGHRMSILSFHSQQPGETLLANLKQLWRDNIHEYGSGYVENRSRDWIMLSTINQQQQQIVAQFSTSRSTSPRSDAVGALGLSGPSGSSGLISLMSLHPIRDTGTDELSFLDSAKVLSSSLSHDASGKNSNRARNVTKVVFSPLPGTSAAQKYKNILEAEGWVVVAEGQDRGRNAILFNKQAESLDLAVVEMVGGSSLVTINHRKMF